MPPEFVIQASGLVKRYGEKRALDGVDLQVPRGTVHGLLGPNGAGKTTTVRILSTLTTPDGGQAEVAGYDVAAQPREVRRRIGLTGQQTAVDDLLSARQNLTMFGRLFRLDKSAAQKRADQLLEVFGLTEAASRTPKKFSGGMRRRLDLAASMILAPEVLYLDEPTTGLDPAGRREVWEAVQNLAAEGTTVLLTTHYLDEADKLCDRISVIDHGMNFVEDTPAGLKQRIGQERLEVAVADPAEGLRLKALLQQVLSAEPAEEDQGTKFSLLVTDGVSALTSAAAAISAEGIEIADIGLRRPTLDEAFLHLTAKTAPQETS
ncbi:ATP-binding cassette domain-containing protein [Nesterenkonia sp. MY13]|uniref:ATP-binding cassette domain-containing protein n=1 Tax=Nesterenkonia sedimenti TaxID=1463632 RepID=A0A7X8TJD7_9MICC|nr:ATP-binding cassette domain-containing protein [Nesterenkonia sedimenti]NLS09178.1 ATP-binding cassette domain-containing protein [Nesterenkonia sedimenti]